MNDVAELTKRDLEHLRLLSIGHYLMAALSIVFGLLFVATILIGIGIGQGVLADPETPPAVGWVYVAVGAIALLACWAYGAAMVVAGRQLRARRRWTYVIVMAAITFTGFQPIGPLLAVFTILVLMRPGVRATFERKGGSTSTPVRF